MRHPLLSGLLLILGLLALASPVQASGWVEEEGFGFRLPAGFEPISETMAGDLTSFQMKLGGGFLSGPDLEMAMKAYARDFGSTDQTVLAVIRMTAGGELGEKLQEQFDPQAMSRQMQQALDQARYPGGMGQAELIEARAITLGTSHPAALLVMSGEDPRLGDQIVRLAIANHETSLYFIMLSGQPSRAREDEALWSAFTTTVKLTSVGGIGRLLRTYWYVPAGLVILLLLVVMSRSRSEPPRRRVAFDGPAAPGASAEGASFSRAMDGLPMYSDPPAPGGSASGPPLESRPTPQADVGGSAASAPQTLRRTLPTSAPAPADPAAASSAPSASAPVDVSALRRPDAAPGLASAPRDLDRPPGSTTPPAPTPPPADDPLAALSDPVRPTNVADRIPAEDEDSTRPSRFQRNQDYVG